jgi:hypothetical protein
MLFYDCSGTWSVIGEMVWEHEFDENQQGVTASYMKSCQSLRSLNLVRSGEVTAWVPIRRSDGSLESVATVIDQRIGHGGHLGLDLRRSKYDCDGFPDNFSFLRRVRYCEERFDPPGHWRKKGTEIENWVSVSRH